MIKERGVNFFDQLPGTKKRLDAYNTWPRQPQDVFELALAVSYCKGMLPPIQQHSIVESIAREAKCKDVMIVGVGDLGRRVAGIGNFTTDSDGKPSSHGLGGNDKDIVILSHSTGTEFQEVFIRGANEGIRNILVSEPGINHMSTIRAEWSKPSLWGIPPYLKIQVDYGKSNDWHETIHVHHQQIDGDGTTAKLLRDYQPWYSNRFGAPLFLGTPDPDGSFDHNLWNPIQTTNGSHLVRVSSPEIFPDSPRAILQTTRIALGAIQAGMICEMPAEIPLEDICLMKYAVKKHSACLTSPMRASAERRLATILHRVYSLEYFVLGPWSPLETMYSDAGLSNPVIQVQKILDEVEWGRKVIGQTVKNWLEENLQKL